jgi:hypothetical protein
MLNDTVSVFIVVCQLHDSIDHMTFRSRSAYRILMLLKNTLKKSSKKLKDDFYIVPRYAVTPEGKDACQN